MSELPTYSLFEVYEHGTVVHVDFATGLIVTWNESATFNVWSVASALGEPLLFANENCFTNYNATSGTAPEIARQWIQGE